MPNLTRLKKLRNEQRLKQEELADILNIKRPTYSKWETGGSYPSYEDLFKIAKFFNVTTDYLLGLTDIRTVAEPEPMLKNINQEQKEAIKALLQLNSIQLAKAHGYILGLTSKNPNIFDL